MRTLTCLAAVVAVLGISVPAGAEVVSFRVGQDLTGTSTPYGAQQHTWISGAGSNFANDSRGFARDFTAGGGTSIASLLKFEDIFGSSQGLIPDVANPLGGTTVINSATLRVDTDRRGDSTTNPMNVHRVLMSWSTADVSGFAGGAHVGADLIGLAGTDEVAPATTPALTGDIRNFDVTDIVQGWHDGSFDNNGFAFLDTGAGTTQFVLHSTNNHEVMWQPVPNSALPLLTVDFTVIPPLAPEPGSLILWAVLAIAAGTMWWRRRRLRAAPAECGRSIPT